MEIKRAYRDALPAGKTLCVYNNDELIFSSSGKWLMPIFELEQFLLFYEGPREGLSAHDTAVGKAAAVLMVRFGIRRMHAELASDRAKQYIDTLNRSADHPPVELSWSRKIDKLLCATEDQLAPMSDPDAMYRILRQRAKIADGKRS